MLRLHNYIVKFHTKRRYGITYSTYGLISVKTFVKVSFASLIFLDFK